LLEDRVVPSISSSGLPSWEPEGPGPIVAQDPRIVGTNALPGNRVVGAVESVVSERVTQPDGSQGYVVYAGTANGGVWRSDNINPNAIDLLDTQSLLSINWVPLTDTQQSLAVSSLALDPRDPSGNTLWVGTGSLSSANEDGGSGVGLLRTTDGGQTWSVLGQSANETVDGASTLSLQFGHVLSVVPTTFTDNGTGVGRGGQVVLVASDSVGLVWSRDGGQTFVPVSDALSGPASDLVQDPNNPQRFYAALPGQGIAVGTYNPATGDLSFQLDNTGFASTLQGRLDLQYADAIKLSARANGTTTVLYAGLAGPDLFDLVPKGDSVYGIYRSDVSAAGQTAWSLYGPSPLPAIPTDRIAPNDLHFSLTADPSNPNVVYVGGGGGNDALYVINQTTATPLFGGTTHGTSPHADSRSLTFLDSGHLLETDDGGIYALSNPKQYAGGGKGQGSWVALNGNLEDTEFFGVAYDSARNVILGGSQDNGTELQAFSENTLWNALTGGDGGPIGIDAAGNRYSYADGSFLRNDQKVYLSDPTIAEAIGAALYTGLNSTDQTRLTNEADHTDEFFPFALHPTQGGRLLYGMTGVYESFDGGDTIFKVTPVDSSGKSLINGNVSALTYAQNNPDAAYVATNKGQLFVRTSSTAGFSAMTPPQWTAGAYAKQIVVDPIDYQTAYVLDSTGDIWVTTDAGATASGWTKLTYNLTNFQGSLSTSIRTIALYDPGLIVPGGGTLLAGGMGGVFRLPLIPPTVAGLGASFGPFDLGPTLQPNFWTQVGQGLPNVVVSDLHYVPGADLLLAGTLGRGAWTVSNASNYLGDPGILTYTSDTAGEDIRLLRDPSNPAYDDLTVNGNVVDVFPLASVQQIQINGLAGTNNLTVDSSNGNPIPSEGLVYNGGPGPNNGLVVSGGSYASEVDTAIGSTHGGAGTLQLDDSTISYSNVFHIDDLNGDTETVSIFGVPHTLTGGFTFTRSIAAADTIQVANGSLQGMPAVSISDPQGGFATVNLAAKDNLSIQDTSGMQVALDINDATDGKARTVTLSQDESGQGTVTGLLGPAITYSGVSSLSLEGGSGGNIFFVVDVAAGAPVTIHGGQGNDVFFMPASLADIGAALTLDGQGGTNSLDYFAYQGNVTVDLPAGTASGVSGGISNIQDVRGGQGTSILVGNGGNVLIGGTGRNLLIAGARASTLEGNSDEDILVGGTTNFDGDVQALDALMTEWTRTDLPYASRVEDLLVGGGHNGTTLLNTSTFHSNGGGNTMTGGPGLDLFYGLLPGDSGTADTTDWNAAQGEVFVDPNGVHVQVGIDATHLNTPILDLDNQLLSTSSPQSLSLQPGTHTLSVPGGGSVSFKVGLSGVISYDPTLEGILRGQGTNQLTVNGAGVIINAQALTNPTLVIDYYIVRPTGSSFQVNLLPGNHLLSTYGAGGQFNFTVKPDGTTDAKGVVGYDPSLEGLFRGQGSNQLTVNGTTVNLNVQALSNPSFVVDYYKVEPTATMLPVHLLPGNHLLQGLGGGLINFTVNPDGSVSIDKQLVAAGIVTVQGNNLTVNGATVHVNARLLTNPNIYVDYYIPEATATSFPLHLLPGQHLLQGAGGGSVNFTVNPNGSVSIDQQTAAAGILTLQGKNNLTVNGATVHVNAHALTNPTVYVDYYAPEAPAAPFTLHLLPGQHLLQGAGGGLVNFTVNPNGSVSIDQQTAAAGILTLQGKNNLTVNGATVHVNAQALTNPTVYVDYYAPEAAAAQFTLHLLPGQHLLQGPSGSVTFTINPDGTITIPASEDALLSLQGSMTLIVKALS
jgi:hypothetical protein